MNIWELILELLYPSRCVFCRRLTNPGIKVCACCEKKLPFTSPAAREQHFSFVTECLSPLYYEGCVRESLLRYKFHGAAAYAEQYGRIISKCIDEKEISCDIITWVPLSRKRLRKRGYDQARLIAEEISGLQGFECVQLLKKIRNNPAQSGAGKAEKRRANVAGVYTALNGGLAQGKRVLIVDDIVTTGATLSECGSVLKNAGAKSVSAVTLARARD